MAVAAVVPAEVGKSGAGVEGVKKTILIGLFWLFLLGAGLLATRTSLAANLWNIRFLKADAKGGSPPAPISSLNWRQQVWLGRAALQRGDLSAARVALMDLESNPKPLAVAALGELYAAEGDTEKTIAVWSEQENYQALSQAAEAAEQAGQFEQSEAYYLAAYQLASTEIILKLSSLYMDKINQPEKAIPFLEQIITTYPTHERWPVWQRLLGDACRKMADWSCAEQAYGQALEVNPDDVLSLVGLGHTARDGTGDVETALSYYYQATERQPQQYEGHLALAEAFAAQGRWERADHSYMQAINARPDLVGLYIARAKTVVKSGNLALGRQLFDEAQTLFPESDILYYEYAALEYQAGDLAAARKLIEQALMWMQPPQPWFYRQAGIIYAGLQDSATARDILLQGLDRFPQEASLFIELAIVEKQLNQPEAAIESIVNALSLSDQPAASYLARAGFIYEWVGDTEKALEYYRQALLLDPNDPVALPGFQRLSGD